MTEADYRWLENDNTGATIRVVAGSEWHYAQGGWHETDPVPDLTAADIEAQQAQWVDDAPEEEEPVTELADNEQEPDPETPEEESE